MKDSDGVLMLFEKLYGTTPIVIPLTGGGSPRRYFRLQHGDISVVGVYCEDSVEASNFIRLDEMLFSKDIKVPRVLKVSEDKKSYLLEDLGDKCLLEVLLSNKDNPESLKRLAIKALADLVNIQTIQSNYWSALVGYPPFGPRLIKWDLNYFKYDFLKPADIVFNEDSLEDDFDRLVSLLTEPGIESGLMYRDFQSRNIMVKDDTYYYIDFQGARKGPLVYDAVSFIWQAKAPFSIELREKLEEEYARILSEKREVVFQNIMSQIGIMKLFRTLQVLGAYGFRGLIERKPHFLESIPGAVENLNYFKEKGLLNDYPEIKKIAERLSQKYKKAKSEEVTGLTIEVSSFSYKKGYPVNTTGNGGGFMFDCRAIHNPGRYQQYKNITGREKEVIEFLESNDEAKDFVTKAIGLVRPSVERYLQRGFTSLQIGFGCTGGQHRSVYCAEKFASEIKSLFPMAKVILHHREQNIIEEVNI